jgi:hypothetical protein
MQLALWFTVNAALLNLCLAQQPKISWVRSAGGPDEDYGWAVAVDRSSQILVAGHFTGPADFGSTNFERSSMLDIFLAKYDAAGQLLWVRSAGGPGDDDARGVATHADGSSYLTGNFTGPASFSQFRLDNLGGADIFLAKYDSAGNALWAKQAGGSGDNQGRSVAVDRLGNVSMTGYFSGSGKFDSTNIVSRGLIDVFLAKYDPGGNLLWVRSAGGTNADEAFAVTIDGAGNNFVTGTFNESAQFGDTTLVSFGASDVFVAKYDPDGALRWVRQGGGAEKFAADTGFGIAADFEGNVVVTGSFMSAASFGDVKLSHAGGGDIFVVKYSGNGSVLWAQRFGGPGPDQGHTVCVDANGDIYVTGFFVGTVAFGPTVLNSPGHAEVFVIKLDAGGTLLWALQPGGTAYKSGTGLAVDSEGVSFVTGFFRGTTAFGGFTLTNNFISNRNVFIARIDGPFSPLRLAIARAENQIVLSWAALSRAFQLESADRLTDNPAWSPAPAVAEGVDGRSRVTNDLTGARRFYRLRRP